MAESNYLLLRLQPSDLNCTICLSYYNHPTTLPCGHTFCKECMEKFWKEKQKCSCPVCKAAFPYKPELNKNTDLAAILEILQELKNSSHQDCDSCTGPGVVKLCLPCMTPLCRDHVLLHSKDTIQQRHLLVNPLNDGSAWPCRQHEKGLQYFCPSHGSPLCPQCVLQHEECKPISLLNLYTENRDKIQKRIGDLSADISSKEQDVTDMKSAFRETQILVSDIKDNLTKDFQEMRDYIEKQERASFWRIKQEQDEARRKMFEGVNAIISELEEMKKIREQLENTLLNDWLEMLKDTIHDNATHKPSTTDVRNYNMLDENKIVDTTFSISQIKRSLLAHPLLEQAPCPPKKVIEDTVDIPSAAAPPTFSEPLPENPKERSLNPFLQWAYSISFDVNTVNNRLYLSKDKKKVTVTGKTYQYPSHPRRFTGCQVMCSPGFSSGCWYWEISAQSSKAWAIGVVCSEISKEDHLGRNDLSWCVEWNKEKLYARHGNENIDIPLPRPAVVGVVLDCAEKGISFYSISEGSQALLHSYKLHFQTELYPAVWLYGLASGNSLTINDIKRL